MIRWSMGLSLVIAAAFAALMVKYEHNPHGSPTLEVLAGKTLDLKFALRGHEAPRTKIVIVAGDERSFQTFGQRPWDRSLVFSPMLKTVCGHGARAFGIDHLWSERERPITGRLKERVASLLAAQPGAFETALRETSGEATVKQAIADCGRRVVLAYSLQDVAAGVPKEEFESRIAVVAGHAAKNTLQASIEPGVFVARMPGDEKANTPFNLVKFSGLIDTVEQTPPDNPQGFINVTPDSDGIYRSTPIFARVGNWLLPSLEVRIAQIALGLAEDPPGRVHFDKHTTSLTYASPRGPHVFPADAMGRLLINYHSGDKAYPYVSLADVVSDAETITAEYEDVSGKLQRWETTKSELFKDAIAIYTFTAQAANDIRPRPFAQLAIGGENHAYVIDNLVTGDFLTRPLVDHLALYVIGILILSLAFGWGIGKLGSKWGGLAAGGIVVGIFAVDQLVLFERHHIFVFGALVELQLALQYFAVTLIKLFSEEKEKRYIRSAFDKFVSPAVIDSLIADPSKLSLGGEKRSLSILFSDIRGFTTLSEKLDVKTLTLVLNEYLGAMTEILQNNSGTLDKYIGDAVMGFWGAPIDVPAHAELAVKTAVEMLAKLAEINPGFQSRYGIALDIGIGINTGEVSVGNFGSSRVFEYTIIGDNVNLASRLEGVNKMYGTHVIVSESTHTALPPGRFLSRAVDIVKVKGKEKPVKIFEIIPDDDRHATLKQALPEFEAGLRSFYARDWREAAAHFESVLKIRDTDQAALNLLERARAFAVEPPPPDWDGSHELESK